MQINNRTIDRLMDVREVAQRLGLCGRTVRKMAAAGVLPAGVRIGRRARRWRESDIRAFIESLGSER